MIQQSHSLGIYLKETLIQKDTYTPMFIAALFTVAKTWINRWIKMYYMNKAIYETETEPQT